MGSDFETQMFHNEHIREILSASDQVGPFFVSEKRISQHLCAPLLNPNARIGCKAPLNYETRHLPPELRDFRLELRNIDFSFLPGPTKLENLIMYEFNGGNQDVAADESLLHLPQFKSQSTQVNDKGEFDLEMFSPLGMPSFIAIFCRTNVVYDYKVQPSIQELSIMCNTTMKKSNTILNASLFELYHLTQRNVHYRSRYDRHRFQKRQTILLSAEDIGMLGLDPEEYQQEKRALFRFTGQTDYQGKITVTLIYNNRALHVFGKQLAVRRLTESTQKHQF